MTEFHADDFGLFTEQSLQILRCWEHGFLNGTSVFPNGDDLQSCLALLPDHGISLTIHLNLMQGHCLANPDDIPLLVDRNGFFKVHFSNLLFCSLLGNYHNYKKQLKIELTSQIKKLMPFFQQNNMPLRIDGHAHWHMIPVVFDALMESIRDERFRVTYIRFPSEPIKVYIKNLFRIIPFPFINIIKTLLLRVLARRNMRRWAHMLSQMESKVFLGVLLSGCFDLHRMQAVLPDAEHHAASLGQGLELLAHPGSVHNPSDIIKITNKNDLLFFTSPARSLEAESLMHICDDNSKDEG